MAETQRKAGGSGARGTRAVAARAALLVGLCGYYFYTYIFFNRLFFVPDDSFHFHPVFVQGGLTVAACALLALSLFGRRSSGLRPWLAGRGPLAPCILVVCLFAAAVVTDGVGFAFLETNGAAHLVVQAVACLLFGVASVLYTLLWASLYERLSFALMMAALSGAFVLSVAVRSLTFFDMRANVLWDLVFGLVIAISLGLWLAVGRLGASSLVPLGCERKRLVVDRALLSTIRAPLAAILAVGFGTGLTWGQASSLGFSPLWASVSAVLAAAVCIGFGKRGQKSQRLRSTFFSSVFPLATLLLLASLLWDNLGAPGVAGALFQLIYYLGLSLFEVCILASLIVASQGNGTSCGGAILVKFVAYGLAFLAGKLCTLFLGDASMTFLLVGVLMLYLAFNIVMLAVSQVTEAAGATPSVGDVLTGQAVEAYGLTPREREVLSCLLEGRSYEGIGRVLFISSSTVKTHVRHIYEKMGVANRDELIDRIAR